MRGRAGCCFHRKGCTPMALEIKGAERARRREGAKVQEERGAMKGNVKRSGKSFQKNHETLEITSPPPELLNGTLAPPAATRGPQHAAKTQHGEGGADPESKGHAWAIRKARNRPPREGEGLKPQIGRWTPRATPLLDVGRQAGKRQFPPSSLF